MTLIDQVFEHIREHPTDTPTQIGKALGIERNHVSAYIIKKSIYEKKCLMRM